MDLSDFSLDELCTGGGGGVNELSRLTTQSGGVSGGELRFYSEAMNIPQVRTEMMEDDLDFDTNFYEQLLDAKVLGFEAEPVLSQTTSAPALNQWGFPSNIKIEDIFQVEQCDLNLSPTLAELNASSDPPAVDPLSNLDCIMTFSLDDPLCSPSPSKPSPIASASSPVTSTTDISGTPSVKNSGSFLTEQSVSTMDWSFDTTPIKQEFKPNLYLSSLSSSCPASSNLFVNSHAWRATTPLVKKEPSSSSLDAQPSFPFASEIEERKPLLQPSLSSTPDTSILSSSAPVGCGMLINRTTFRQRNNSTTDKSLGSLSSLSISNDEGFDSHDDESNPEDDLSSDGESLFPEEGITEEHAVALLLDYGSASGSAPGKKKKRYFWQYNTQSKGPKGSRLTASFGADNSEDPHTFPHVSDPVFSAECHAAGVKHAGKARRGDGNDLTPNPRKLFSIGLELRKLNKVINELAPTQAELDSRPAVTRKEKNKLASRACRLKKKAQHEANKLKLHGLQEEHKRLLTALSQVKALLVQKMKSDGGQPQDSKHELSLPSLLKEIDELPPIAGQTTEFVNEVLQRVAKGDPTGGLSHHFHHQPPSHQTD